MDTWIVAWLGIGVLLILAETIVPGAVLSFLGIAAISTGLLIQFNLIEGFIEITITYLGIATFLLLVIRTIFLKFLPGDESITSADETEEWQGAIVTVIEDIRPEKPGRIRFRDSTWSARSEDYIANGESAIITNQRNQQFIVKPIN